MHEDTASTAPAGQTATLLRPCQVELPIQVRTYDIDFMGHVSNIVYLRWLEDLRLLMLQRFLPLEQQIAAGYAPVLLHTEIHYRRPVRLFDAVVGTMWLSAVTRARFALQARIRAAGLVAVEATQSAAFVALATGRPVRVPAAARRAFVPAADPDATTANAKED